MQSNKIEANSEKKLIQDRDESLLLLFNEESDSISESLDIISSLSKKYKISHTKVLEFLQNKGKYLAVPVGIFRSSLSPLESIVRYLKDVLNYRFSNIASLLNRDETTIWTTYNNSTLKEKNLVVDIEFRDVDFAKLNLSRSNLIVPVNNLSDRKISILEAVCMHLRDMGINYRTIGQILNRNERTIWTAVNRAKKKLMK